MKNLNILHLPLHGIRLIEASAGTGKTYNLIIIYLRLLLNIRTSPSFLKPLTVTEILVVTFTKSAVQSLRMRIKKNIHQFRTDCIRGYSNNYLFSELLSEIRSKHSALIILETAEKDIEKSSIFTIHSFCQKIITENIMEFNIPFHTSITENKLSLYHQICTDFWRRYFYPLPSNIINLILQYWKNPTALLKDIYPYIHKEIPKLQYSQFFQESNKKHISIYYDQIIHCIDSVKKQWHHAKKHNIIKTIYTYTINRRIYNKKNLTSWVNKIQEWTEQSTHNHSLPNHLVRFRSSRFELNENIKNSCIFPLLQKIEELYQRLVSFKGLIFDFAIHKIQQNLNTNKTLRSEITFDDLIYLLHDHIKKKNCSLTYKISKCYPIAIIDEFQDTDPNQYNIFHKIYSHQPKKGLILIGDPKQTIYNFRGANIFTYIKVQRSLQNKYNLNINWRSSPGMVNAINQLFNTTNPFVFPDIQFVPSLVAQKNSMHKFLIGNQIQPSICFWLQPNDYAITNNVYKTIMAKECAVTLQKLLYNIHNHTAWIQNHKHKKKILQTSDIVVLVRNHEEASIIQSELSKISIPTIFSSDQSNIFSTIESYELLLLLKAILFPDRQSICTALTTIFFCLDASKIENINNNESKWKYISEEFSEYSCIWKKHNILSMIQKIIFRYKIPEKLLSTKIAKNNLINILHLGEILNNVSKKLATQHSLIKWLELKIINSQNKQESPDYVLRRNHHDQELIKISTIHKSKGLEFPLTFLPFMSSNVNYNRKTIFHDRKSFELCMDFEDSPLHLKFSDEERLSEDLRLLYVAITRSIYHCAIGIAPIIHKNQKKISSCTTLYKNAVEYLLQNQDSENYNSLKKNLIRLNTISNGDISFRVLSKTFQHQNLYHSKKNIYNQHLIAKNWKPSCNITNNRSWNITSYSDIKTLNQTTKLIHFNPQELLNINLYQDHQNTNDFTTQLLTPHTFPKGKVCGHFFHNLLQILDFTKLENKQWLQTQMIQYDISLDWEPILWEWIDNIVNTPLDQKKLTLSKITPQNKQTELKFLLTINANLHSIKLNHLCKQYDPLSFQSSKLIFPKITGMLQGFIDLLFYWNKKYYLIDYKTNWLGENNNFYSISKIKKNMIQNHYALQYQLYTLAVHRFLKNRITSYSYEKDFGGVYYLFIRGMDGTPSNNGVYFCRPSWDFIRKLNSRFLHKHI